MVLGSMTYIWINRAISPLFYILLSPYLLNLGTADNEPGRIPSLAFFDVFIFFSLEAADNEPV